MATAPDDSNPTLTHVQESNRYQESRSRRQKDPPEAASTESLTLNGQESQPPRYGGTVPSVPPARSCPTRLSFRHRLTDRETDRRTRNLRGIFYSHAVKPPSGAKDPSDPNHNAWARTGSVLQQCSLSCFTDRRNNRACQRETSQVSRRPSPGNRRVSAPPCSSCNAI